MKKQAKVVYSILAVFYSSHLLASIPSSCEGAFYRLKLSFISGQIEFIKPHLDTLIAQCPDAIEAQELVAQIKISEKKWEEARQIFLKLHSTPSTKPTHRSREVYAFHLGVLSFLLEQYEPAIKHLNEALTESINPDVCHYLLGKIFQLQNNALRGREEFHQINERGVLKQLADLNYAVIEFEDGNIFQGYEALVESQLNENHSNLMQGLLKSSADKLKNEDLSQWIKWVGLSTDYDSNVFNVANTDPGAAGGEGSLKETLALRLAHATSPVQKDRYVGFYQSSVNYNFEAATRTGQFMTHELGGSWTRGFLQRFQYGAKLSGLGLWQYRSNAFRPYSLSGNLGLFLKSKIGPESYMGLETSFIPNKNYLDPTLTDGDKRSGWEQQLRFFYNQIGFKRLFRPSVGLVTTLLRPAGKNFQGYRLGFEAVNFISLSDKWYFTQSLALGGAWYLNRPTQDRRDQYLSGLLRSEYLWDKSLTLAAQIDFTRNFSSDPTYRFNRWVGGVSGSYLF